MSHFVELLVWAPVAVISEGSEYHIEADSNLKLHCSLRQQSPENGSNKTLPLSVKLSSDSHMTLPTVSRPIPLMTDATHPSQCRVQILICSLTMNTKQIRSKIDRRRRKAVSICVRHCACRLSISSPWQS